MPSKTRLAAVLLFLLANQSLNADIIDFDSGTHSGGSFPPLTSSLYTQSALGRTFQVVTADNGQTSRDASEELVRVDGTIAGGTGEGVAPIDNPLIAPGMGGITWESHDIVLAATDASTFGVTSFDLFVTSPLFGNFEIFGVKEGGATTFSQSFTGLNLVVGNHTINGLDSFFFDGLESINFGSNESGIPTSFTSNVTLDNISIVPEPGASLFLGGFFFVVALCRRSRRKSR